MELPKNRRQTQVLRARTPAMEGPSPAMMPWRVRQFFCFFFSSRLFPQLGQGSERKGRRLGPGGSGKARTTGDMRLRDCQR